MQNSKLIPHNFSVIINASVETVWHKMLDLETYKIWTSEFDKSSYYEGSWEQDQNILFKSADGRGIAGKISKNEHLKLIEITYQSWLLPGGVADTESEGSLNSKGAIESYTFSSLSEDSTRVDIFVEVRDEFIDFMKDQWPKALNKLKEICESDEVSKNSF